MGPSKGYLTRRVRALGSSALQLVTSICAQTENVIDLGQGRPDWNPPCECGLGAIAAIVGSGNQYSRSAGLPEVLQAVANKLERFNRITCLPRKNLIITCGASQALMAAMQTFLEEGDEAIVLEPFYESYPDLIRMAGGRARYVRLHLDDTGWQLDLKELTRAFNKRTRVLLWNTPHNPTGFVPDLYQMRAVAELCIHHDVIAITDEIYEHYVYDGSHISLATLPGMRDRTVTISGLSKTFAMTGWRLGYACVPTKFSRVMKKVHQRMVMNAPTPLQYGALAALQLPDEYYADLLLRHRMRRDFLYDALVKAGFRCHKPQGTYYLFPDCSELRFGSDRLAWRHLLDEYRIGSVFGSCFYKKRAPHPETLRFCFSKQWLTLERAEQALGAFAASRS